MLLSLLTTLLMRRKLIAVSALPACFVLGLCAQIIVSSWSPSVRHEPPSLSGTAPQHYDLSGPYYPASDFPLTFETIRRLDLNTYDFRVNSDSSVTRTSIAPKGYLVTDFDVYKLSSVKVDGDRLRFTTEPRAGVSYKFIGRTIAGTYPIKGFSQYYEAQTILVHGRLVRMVFGFKIAEEEVRFTKGSAC